MATEATWSTDEASKRKLANALLLRGMDTSPVQAWTQGAARIANALVGGMMQSDLDNEEKASLAQLQNLPGLGGPQPAPSPVAPPSVEMVKPDQFNRIDAAANPQVAAMAPPAAPVMTPRPEVHPSAKVWGDKEAEAAGLYPPSRPTAVGNPAIGQPNGILPQRTSVAIPPDVAMSVRQMLANPRTRTYGLAIYSQFAKPSDQYMPVQDARGSVVGQRSTLTGEIKSVPQDPEPLRVVQEMYARPQSYGFTGPNDPALQEAARHKLSGQANTVSVSTVANPVLEGVGKQIVQGRASAQAASQLIPQIHDARRVLDEGMTTGAFADPRLFAQKVGALFGMDAKDAANAETFRAIVGNQVLGHIKTLGANPSNTDRDYIEKIMGGQIALEPSSLRKIMDINEKYARQAIKQFNADSKKLLNADPNAYRGIAPLMQIDEPGNYTGGSVKQRYGLE